MKKRNFKKGSSFGLRVWKKTCRLSSWLTRGLRGRLVSDMVQNSQDQDEQNTSQPMPDELEPETVQNQPEAQECDAQAKLEADLLQWKDRAARTAAEYDNYRKRMAREREDIVRYANTRLLEELLPVVDNFDMGMQAAASDTSSMIYIGMQMVRKQLDEFLANQNVKEIVAEGQMFDHKVHEAIGREEHADLPDGQIIRVVRKGYNVGDSLLRPANVIVSHHPEEPASEEKPAEA